MVRLPLGHQPCCVGPVGRDMGHSTAGRDRGLKHRRPTTPVSGSRRLAAAQRRYAGEHVIAAARAVYNLRLPSGRPTLGLVDGCGLLPR